MKLNDVVRAILKAQNVQDKDIKKTVVFLLNACKSKYTIMAIAKLIKEMDEYERAPVT